MPQKCIENFNTYSLLAINDEKHLHMRIHDMKYKESCKQCSMIYPNTGNCRKAFNQMASSNSPAAWEVNTHVNVFDKGVIQPVSENKPSFCISLCHKIHLCTLQLYACNITKALIVSVLLLLVIYLAHLCVYIYLPTSRTQRKVDTKTLVRT